MGGPIQHHVTVYRPTYTAKSHRKTKAMERGSEAGRGNNARNKLTSQGKVDAKTRYTGFVNSR